MKVFSGRAIKFAVNILEGWSGPSIHCKSLQHKDDFSLSGSKRHPPISWKHLWQVHLKKKTGKQETQFFSFSGFPKIPLVSYFLLSWGRRQAGVAMAMDFGSITSQYSSALCHAWPICSPRGDPIQLEVSFVVTKWANKWPFIMSGIPTWVENNFFQMWMLSL